MARSRRLECPSMRPRRSTRFSAAIRSRSCNCHSTRWTRGSCTEDNCKHWPPQESKCTPARFSCKGCCSERPRNCRSASLRCAMPSIGSRRSSGKTELTRLEGLLAMTMQRSEIARLVVGVTSEQELSAIVGAAEKAGKGGPLEIANPPVVDTRFLNPSRWSELGTE